MLGGASATAATEVTPPAFEARIDRALATAAEGLRVPRASLMESVRTELDLPAVLALPAGTLQIPADFFDRLSGERTQDFDDAIARLRAMRAGIEEAVAAPDAADARAQVADALRGMQTRPNLAQLAREGLDRLLGFIGHGFAAAAGSTTVSILFAFVAAVLLIMLAFVLIRRIRLVEDRAVADARGDADEDPRRALEEALRHGDFDAAVRAQFRLLVHELAAQGVVPEAPSLTAGEFRDAVRAARLTVYPVVEEATSAFERVVYGDVEPADEHVQLLRRATRAASRT